MITISKVTTLQRYRNVCIIIFLAHQYKAPGVKIRLSKNNNHDGVSYGVKCSQGGDRIPPWRATDKRWNWNTVSLVSSVTAVMHLPISWISCMADWFQVPAVSTATDEKIWEAESAPYFTILFAAALFAAEHASQAVWSMCDSA